ncbi:MAG: trypsin-like peptidase domain-containing protein [Phycisphaerae bacterium]|nr:trypsin-like peptidase domain-containing protein [Phycisphaerae bacterium]
MRRFVSYGPALVVFVTVLLVLALAPAAVKQVQLAGMSATVMQAQARLDQQASLLEQLNQATRDVADAVLPGIVHIQVRAQVAQSQEEGGGRRFSGPRASAAGWFYNTDGFIVTNSHVVADAEMVRVETYDGRVREAQVVGSDPRTDIAVIRVPDLTNTLPLRRATGQAVFVGDRVFAFGSPFGIKFSMSQGIVSGLGRSEAASLVGMRSGYTNFIQTDAAMNPGNSGGPLVDARGRVIGMSTAIANNVEYSFNDRSPQGQSAGIGFAIPIETIESVVSQLMESNVVIRGHLGIALRDYPSPFDVRGESSYEGVGAMVREVRPNGPAAKSGLQAGDIIIEVAGQPCLNQDVLRSVVSIRGPATVIPMKVWRGGEPLTIRATIGSAYFGTNERGEEDLIYIEGSEGMTMAQVREKLKGLSATKRLD